MAIRFHLRDGSISDVVGQSYNGFPVRNAEEFLGLLRALTAPAQDAALEAFLASHPAAKTFVETPKPAPRSFATAAYHGINALRFTNREGTRRCGRYRIVPVAGESYLETEEVARLPANFMFDEIKESHSRSPIEFRLTVQLAEEGDPVDDATARWPEDRPLAELGLLTVIKRVIDSDAVQRALAFDPGRLTDGIEPTEDPLIATRSAVYAIAAQRRSE
jgi:catalase